MTDTHETRAERITPIVARALATMAGLRRDRENIDPWLRDARCATKAALEADRPIIEGLESIVDRVQRHYSVGAPLPTHAEIDAALAQYRSQGVDQ